MTNNGPFLSHDNQSLDFGILLGQRRALTLVAGRCSGAHAAVLRKIRDEKLYRPYAPSWTKYCGPHLKISRRHCDRLIALLNEFGPVYFELAELVGITPEQYRRIQPAIRENAVHLGAEVIALDPENSAALAAAITRLLREPTAQSHVNRRSPGAQLDRLDSAGRSLAYRFERLLKKNPRNRERVLESIRALRVHLGSLDPLEL